MALGAKGRRAQYGHVARGVRATPGMQVEVHDISRLAGGAEADSVGGASRHLYFHLHSSPAEEKVGADIRSPGVLYCGSGPDQGPVHGTGRKRTSSLLRMREG